MNVIALTGANVHAMADAAHLLLEAVTQRALNVAVMVYVDCATQVRAIRANSLGITEIWRVGPDPDRRHLDPLVDAFIDDGAALEANLAGQLARYLHRLSHGRDSAAPTLA